jgi:DNA-binding protein YbaB
MLEDLILAAVNSALRASQEVAAAENPLSAMTGMIPGVPR